MSLVIRNGTVYDPANGIDGEVKDIHIEGGKIVEEAEGQEIDASGLIVLPGGVDIHTHIAGSKVNLGRLFRPEDHRRDRYVKTDVARSGVGYSVPTTFVTGYRYARMGYTTVMEAASPPLTAKHTHEELNDTPILDKGAYTLMGNNHFIMRYVKNGEHEKLRDYVAWLLEATKGYTIKIVNPGGVENWKWGKNVDSIDDHVDNYDVTPREILTGLGKANDDLGLPHSIHVHANNLGAPGNFETTAQTIKCVKNRLHMTHLQFNAYAGNDWTDFSSGVPELAKMINRRDNITCDMGQVIFGETTTMTADGPWQHHLYEITGNKWFNADVEMETGAGVVPYFFHRKNPVNAVQWAIGLEIALMVKDPWKVCLSTDHPNGGPFYMYPKIISWLMSKKARDKTVSTINKSAGKRTSIDTLDREYSLMEIATITRATTSRALGLKNKGHLGVGADADISVYEFDEKHIQRSFSRARYTIKDGVIVVRDGEITGSPMGKTFWVDAHGQLTDEVREEFPKFYTVSLDNYPVQKEYLPREEVIRTNHGG